MPIEISNEYKLGKMLGGKEGIVKVLGAYPDPMEWNVVMEVVTGEDLFELRRNQGLLKEEVEREIVRQVGKALVYMHSKGIIYGDLKLENVMVNFDTHGQPMVKLIDLGCAQRPLTPRAPFTCGNPEYYPPQYAYFPSHPYPDLFKTDVYSLGVFTYILHTGRYPFAPQGLNKGWYDVRWMACVDVERLIRPNGMSEEMWGFVRRAMRIRESERPGIEELMRDEWVMGRKP